MWIWPGESGLDFCLAFCLLIWTGLSRVQVCAEFMNEANVGKAADLLTVAFHTAY